MSKDPSPILFTTRILKATDSDAFRALRLKILLSYGVVFESYYDTMKQRPDDF